jgi:hypothetical protein
MNPNANFSCAKLLLMSALIMPSLTTTSVAKEIIKVQDASKNYHLTVQIEACGGANQDNDSNTCSGKTRISIYRKGANSAMQILTLPNVEIYKDTIAYSAKTSEKPRGVYAEEYSFIFDDFNFDGHDDLAVCNGRNGGYGGPSYSIFLFNSMAKRFVENRSLSKLAEGVYLGLFFVEPKNKRLVAFSKSGCCYHETEKYHVVNDKPFLVEKLIEDATNGETIKVTTKKLINGKWVSTVKRRKLPAQQSNSN